MGARSSPEPEARPRGAAAGRPRFPRGALLLVAVLLVAAVGIAAARRAAPPRPCPRGLVALAERGGSGLRCCGLGQQLELGRCVGEPTGCAEGMQARPEGCVARAEPVALPAGRLLLAGSDWEAEPAPTAREVEVAAFLLDSHEVVAADWQACVAAGQCPPLPGAIEPGRPVTGVTAAEAARYCRFRAGRLPTSEELAWAARGGAGRRYPWGDTGAVCRRAAYGLADGPCGRGATGPELAGARPAGATPEGIHDLAGNVAEWADRGPAAAAPDAPASAGSFEARGGSWRDRAASRLRSWAARPLAPETRADDVGFRCAYSRPPPRAAALEAVPRAEPLQ